MAINQVDDFQEELLENSDKRFSTHSKNELVPSSEKYDNEEIKIMQNSKDHFKNDYDFDQNHNLYTKMYRFSDLSNNHEKNSLDIKNTPLKEFQNLNKIDKYPIKMVVFNFIIGQVLAMVSVSSKIIVTQLQNEYKIVTPLTYNMYFYLMLFVFNICVLRYLKKPKICYIVIAILDSQAIFLNIFAFSKLNFDYPFIMNILTVIFSILITWIFIRWYKYKLHHLFSTILAIVAIATIFFGVFGNDYSFFTKNYEGLIYCLLSSLCLSISTVLMEVTFQSGQEIYEFLPWLGIIGFIISTIQSVIMGDIDRFFEKDITIGIVALIFFYVVLMVTFTQITPFYITKVRAAMYNISLVSQVFYSYIIEVVFYQKSNHVWYYYIGFLCLIISILWFNRYPVEIVIKETSINREFDAGMKYNQDNGGYNENNNIDSGSNNQQTSSPTPSESNSEKKRKSVYHSRNVDFYKNQGLKNKALAYLS